MWEELAWRLDVLWPYEFGDGLLFLAWVAGYIWFAVWSLKSDDTSDEK